MPITAGDLKKRKAIESRFASDKKHGNLIDAESKEFIRNTAIAAFIRKLDAKLKNLQDGEALVMVSDFYIVGPTGKVRGGSGSQRNMPEYIDWRKAVYERDGYKCRQCGSGGQMNAHHIKHWAAYPELRFDIDNGITLCADCHKKEHPHLNFSRNANGDTR